MIHSIHSFFSILTFTFAFQPFPFGTLTTFLFLSFFFSSFTFTLFSLSSLPGTPKMSKLIFHSKPYYFPQYFSEIMLMASKSKSSILAFTFFLSWLFPFIDFTYTWVIIFTFSPYAQRGVSLSRVCVYYYLANSWQNWCVCGIQDDEKLAATTTLARALF